MSKQASKPHVSRGVKGWGGTSGSRQQLSLLGEPALPSRRHQCHSARLNHVCAAEGNNKPHAYLPYPPTPPTRART